MTNLFGSWVIVALLVGPQGQLMMHNPSTMFDKEACMKQAHFINQAWLKAGVSGVATCKHLDVPETQ